MPRNGLPFCAWSAVFVYFLPKKETEPELLP